MTRPTNCTCLHLGTGVHDPTNPHCALFNGADLRLTDGDDEIVAAEIVDRGITGTTIRDDEYAITDMDEITRLPAITLVDTSEDEHRAKAAKLARSNHAFTNFGDPAGLCNVCGAGAGNEIHAAPPVQPPPRTTDIRDVGRFVGLDRGPIDLGLVHFKKVMDYAWCGVYKADRMTFNAEEVTCGTCKTLIDPPAQELPTPATIPSFEKWEQNIRVGPPIQPTLETLNTEITLPQLMVNVDFNELFETKGDEETWEILGKLKDLLQ